MLIHLFENLPGLTPWDALGALRTYIQRCIEHDQQIHDDENVIRWRNLLAMLPREPGTTP